MPLKHHRGDSSAHGVSGQGSPRSSKILCYSHSQTPLSCEIGPCSCPEGASSLVTTFPSCGVGTAGFSEEQTAGEGLGDQEAPGRLESPGEAEGPGKGRCVA